MQNLRVEQGVPVERVRAALPDPPLDLSGGGAVDADEDALGASSSSFDFGAPEALEPAHPLASPVLIFLAYYCETIPEASEVVRSREIILKYHTEDDTVALHEPRVSNAGLPQGKMLKRMRIPLAATQLPARELVGIMPPARPSGPALRAAVVGEHLTWRDLVVGEQLALFGRALRVIACDARTRKWYEAQGQPQPHDLVVHAPKPHHMATAASPVVGGPPSAAAASVPFFGKRVNPEKRYLEAMRGSTSATLTRGVEDKTAQFRAHDPRAVLRFKGCYDDRGRAFGDVVHYDVLYYLADDAVEVVEVRAPNDGREDMGRLWKKGRLPRTVIYHDSRSRDIEDGGGEEDYYSAADLAVGATINVFGRPVLLYDADAKTYAWYLAELGREMSPVDAPSRSAPPRQTVVVVPPHLGYGSEEDSLASLALQPLPPRKDWAKIMSLDGVVYRFHASFAEPKTVPDRTRKFTVSYYPAVDSVAVYEPTTKNSGVVQGQYIGKIRLRNPDTGAYFKAADFVVGRVVSLNSHKFLLEGVDPRTAELLSQAP